MIKKIIRISTFTIVFFLIAVATKLTVINLLLSTHFVRRIIFSIVYSYLTPGGLSYREIYFIPFKLRMEDLSVPYLGERYKFQFFESKIAELKLSPLFFNIEKIIFDDARFLFILDENHKYIKKLTHENSRLKNGHLPRIIKFNNATILISHNKNEMKYENLSIELTKNETGYNFIVQGSINTEGIIDINKKKIEFFTADGKTLTFSF